MSFSLIMLIILGVITVFGAFRGFKRGVERQALRIVTVIVSMFLALLVTNIIDQQIFEEFSSKTPEEVLMALEDAGLEVRGTSLEPIVLNVEPITVAYIFAIPSALIIMPVLYVLIFEGIKLIMLIPYAIFAKLLRLKKKKRTTLSKLLGTVLGAMQGVVVTIILTMPVVGFLSSAERAVESINEVAEKNEDAAAVSRFYDDNLKEYTTDPVVNFLGVLGADGLYESFTTVTIEGTEYDVIDEITAPAASIISSIDCFEDFNWKSPTAENKQGISHVLNAVDESRLVKKVFINVIDVAVKTYKSGEFTIEAESHLKAVVDETANVLERINGESFGEDVTTLLDAYFILGREGVLSAFEAGKLEDVRSALTATHAPHALDPHTPCDDLGEDVTVTVLKKTVEVLDSDKHTRPLITSISKISIGTLAESYGSQMTADEAYDAAKVGITDTLTIVKEGKDEAEYKAEVRASLDNALKSTDIEFGEDEQYILDNMTDYVSENYDTLVKTDEDGNRVISEDEVNRVILSYYDAYLKNGGELEDIVE